MPTGPPFLPDPYGDEYDQNMLPGLAADTEAARGRIAATQTAMDQALAHIGSVGNPYPQMQAPPAPNPMMAGLAGFFAHLNAAQTGSGVMPGALMNSLSQQAAYRHQVEVANAESERQFAGQKLDMQQRTYEKYLGLMTQQAVELGDLPSAYQHQKDLYKLNEGQFKRRATEAADTKEKAAAANSARILQRSLAIEREHAKNRSSSLENKIAYQQALVKFGLKADPSVVAEERSIRAEAQAAIATLRQNAELSMSELDGGLVSSILEQADAKIDALYADASKRVGPDGKVAPVASHTPVATPSKDDPLGMRKK